MDVNEEGTEAAAATGIIMVSVPSPCAASPPCNSASILPLHLPPPPAKQPARSSFAGPWKIQRQHPPDFPSITPSPCHLVTKCHPLLSCFTSSRFTSPNPFAQTTFNVSPPLHESARHLLCPGLYSSITHHKMIRTPPPPDTPLRRIRAKFQPQSTATYAESESPLPIAIIGRGAQSAKPYSAHQTPHQSPAPLRLAKVNAQTPMSAPPPPASFWPTLNQTPSESWLAMRVCQSLLSRPPT